MVLDVADRAVARQDAVHGGGPGPGERDRARATAGVTELRRYAENGEAPARMRCRGLVLAVPS
jgi:hypothetical protein